MLMIILCLIVIELLSMLNKEVKRLLECIAYCNKHVFKKKIIECIYVAIYLILYIYIMLTDI